MRALNDAACTMLAPDDVAAVEPGLYVLLRDGRGGFGGTDSLLVRVDSANRVRSLHFVYPVSQDFTVLLREYEVSLGQPVERVTRYSADGQIERAVWEDSQTRFELTHLVCAGQSPKVTSALVDQGSRR